MEPKTLIIIGAGRVAAKHVKAARVLKDKIKLIAVVDTDNEAAKRLIEASKLPYSSAIKVYSDYEAAIKELKPDMAAITLPSGLHFKVATYALNNNCNILLEKPMTMSSAESHSLYDLSKEKGLKIAMGHIYRYFPLVKLIKEDIAAGKFGDITHGTITVRWGHDQAYYDQAAWRGTWKSDGGAMMNQTIHAIDLLIWLMNSDAVEATALIAKRSHNIEAEDTGMAVLRLHSGALAQIEGTTSTSPSEQMACFNILGTKGSIELGLHNKKPFLSIKNETGKSLNLSYISRQLKEGGIKSFTYALNPHTAIYNDLCDKLVKGGEPTADAKAGYTSVDNMLGIYKSALSKETVKLPLDENFSTVEMEQYKF